MAGTLKSEAPRRFGAPQDMPDGDRASAVLRKASVADCVTHPTNQRAGRGHQGLCRTLWHFCLGLLGAGGRPPGMRGATRETPGSWVARSPSTTASSSTTIGNCSRDLVRSRLAGNDLEDLLRAIARLFVTFATGDGARYQLLFQRKIPEFEPSTDSYASRHRRLLRRREHFSKPWDSTEDQISISGPRSSPA